MTSLPCNTRLKRVGRRAAAQAVARRLADAEKYVQICFQIMKQRPKRGQVKAIAAEVTDRMNSWEGRR